MTYVKKLEQLAERLEYSTAIEVENTASEETPYFFIADHIGHGGQRWGYSAPVSAFGGPFRADDPETYHGQLTDFIEAVRYTVEELEGEEMPEQFDVEIFGLDN